MYYIVRWTNISTVLWLTTRYWLRVLWRIPKWVSFSLRLKKKIVWSQSQFGIFGLKGRNSQNKQNACISAIWTWNENFRALSLFQLLKFNETICLSIFIWRPYGLVMAYLIKVNAYCFDWTVTKISK